MANAPTLQELCTQAIIPLIQQDADKRREFLTLPLDLLGCILVSFTPIVLQLIHDELDRSLSREDSAEELPPRICSSKRSYTQMSQNFISAPWCYLNDVWKCKFDKRWPSGVKRRYRNFLSTSEMELLDIIEDEAAVDWRQRFWEAHLQECLNEAAAQAASPFFEGTLGDITLPDSLLEQIGVKSVVSDRGVHDSTGQSSSSLRYNCWQFGQHARYLRLCGVLCTDELSNLLTHAQLQHVAFSRVATAAQVEGLCIVLKQNNQTLHAVELQHCRFSQMKIAHIRECLTLNGGNSHQLHHFFVLSSRTLFQDEEIISQFMYFLGSGRYLQTVVLIDNQLCPLTASKSLVAFFKAGPNVSLLHVSENELEGFFERERASSILCLCSQTVSLKNTYLSLRALDLRSNKLSCHDIKGLLPYVKFIPFLEHINVSDNPIGDDGLRAIIPFLQGLPVLEFNISKCNISVVGAHLLLESLLALKQPLHSLKLAHNPLGRSIATSLANFLARGVVKRLDIGDIGLGLSGCSELQEALVGIPNLTHLVISKNRLGYAGAGLLCKLIGLARSSALRAIDSSCNLLDSVCLKKITSQLEIQSKADGWLLQLVDLRNNPSFEASEVFNNINHGKKMVVLVSNVTVSSSLSQFYDDDP